MVIKPLVGAGRCHNTIPCINIVFRETISIVYYISLRNRDLLNNIYNYRMTSVDSLCASDPEPP